MSINDSNSFGRSDQSLASVLVYYGNRLEELNSGFSDSSYYTYLRDLKETRDTLEDGNKFIDEYDSLISKYLSFKFSLNATILPKGKNSAIVKVPSNDNDVLYDKQKYRNFLYKATDYVLQLEKLDSVSLENFSASTLDRTRFIVAGLVELLNNSKDMIIEIKNSTEVSKIINRALKLIFRARYHRYKPINASLEKYLKDACDFLVSFEKDSDEDSSSRNTVRQCIKKVKESDYRFFTVCSLRFGYLGLDDVIKKEDNYILDKIVTGKSPMDGGFSNYLYID